MEFVFFKITIYSYNYVLLTVNGNLREQSIVTQKNWKAIQKGNKFELSNYRPISLLTSFSKIFEKVIYKRLVNHVSALNILSKAQYGFRTNMSTDNAIYQLTNNILKALDNKQLVGGMFCDLSKAFDCVNHETLLSKLE